MVSRCNVCRARTPQDARPGCRRKLLQRCEFTLNSTPRAATSSARAGVRRARITPSSKRHRYGFAKSPLQPAGRTVTAPWHSMGLHAARSAPTMSRPHTPPRMRRCSLLALGITVSVLSGCKPDDVVQPHTLASTFGSDRADASDPTPSTIALEHLTSLAGPGPGLTCAA